MIKFISFLAPSNMSNKKINNDLNSPAKAELRTAARYFIVGASGQLSDYLLTLGIYSLTSSLLTSNLVAYTSASIYTYVLHTTFSFKRPFREITQHKRIANFAIACLVGAVISTFVLVFLVKLGLKLTIAKLLQLLIVALIQYLYNRLVTFKHS